MERVGLLLATEGRGILPAKRHGAEGTQARFLAEIDDPVTLAGERAEDGRVLEASGGGKRTVVKIIRPRGVDDMHARGRITDRQMEAATRFSEIWERAHSDGMKAIDYSKVRVDGQSGDLVGEDGTWRAIKTLQRIEKAVGARGYAILTKIVAQGRSRLAVAAEYATASGRSAKMMEGYVTMRLIEALDDLDAMWNVAVGAGAGTRASGIDPADRGGVHVEMALTLPSGVTVEDFERNSAELRRQVTDSLMKRASRNEVRKGFDRCDQ